MNTQGNSLLPTGFTLRVYPSSADIVAAKIYPCPIDDCDVTFQNASHLQMHITRHHRTAAPVLHPVFNAYGKDERKQFFCPCTGCFYHQTPSDVTNGARHFTSFRSLKQHYLKVHGERKYRCSTCEKSFATASFLRHHRLSCGQTFQCEHCSFSYGSREALLTHAKRKKHGYSKLISSKKRSKSISIGTQTTVIGKEDRPTQTVPFFNAGAHSTEAAPNASIIPLVPVDQYRTTAECFLNDGSGSEELMYMQPHGSGTADAAESVVVCTETQTDFSALTYPNAINHHDPLLSYTHMYTQTSDDPGLFADLGLSTIETQTSWNDGGDGFGDYLVSTETQTNFDIESFNGGSHCNDKIDQAVQCKQTQLHYLQRTTDAASETDFLSAMNSSIGHVSHTPQNS